MTSKANGIRDAKARVAAIATQRAELQAQIDEAEKARQPLVAKLDSARRKRAKTSIISNTAGSIWFGTLASIAPETYGLSSLAKGHGHGRKLAQEISDALTTGGLKLNGGRYGVAITLRGLAGRVRVPDSARVLVHKRAVAARVRAEAKATAARQAEADALKACFDTGVKIPTDAILPDLVAEAVAIARLDTVPVAHDLRHQLSRLEQDDPWSPLGIAKQHLAHVLSGSTEPCPCQTCARERQEAIRVRDLNTRLNGLPTVLADCPVEGHGRHRVALENATLKGALDARTRDQWTAKATEKGLTRVLAWLDSTASRVYEITVPRGWCRKGEPRPLVLLAEFEKQLGRRPRKVVADVAAASV